MTARTSPVKNATDHVAPALPQPLVAHVTHLEIEFQVQELTVIVLSNSTTMESTKSARLVNISVRLVPTPQSVEPATLPAIDKTQPAFAPVCTATTTLVTAKNNV